MKKFTLIILLTFFLKSILFAESAPVKGSIKGNVKDGQKGTPVEYASVALFNTTDSTLIAGCITDENGNFRFSHIEKGSYRIEIRFMGYEPLITKDFLIEKETDTGTLQLNPDIKSLEGVEITAERNQIEYKIDKQIINASSQVAAANGSAIDLLKHSPSKTYRKYWLVKKNRN